MATLTNSGRIAMATAIKDLPIYMCWGEGATEWAETVPDEVVTATALSNVVGYRKATSVQYCTPDEASGTISIPSGKYSTSTTATNHLYIKFVFDFADATGNTIREIGVKVNTTAKDTVATGQEYLDTTEVENVGDLLLIENRKPIYRETGVKETFEFVVTF
jgi:hypothetical protein